jgi:DNA-directed RNA polymerase specialized sigma24 family protein
MSTQGARGCQLQSVAAQSKTMNPMLNHEQDLEDLEAFRTLEEFSSCVGKLYWVALVLTGDDKKAREIFLPAVDDMVDSHTFFGEWLCKWTIRIVVTSCARHHAKELSAEKGSGERWRAKLADHSSVKLQFPAVSKERLQSALLSIPLFPRFAFLLRVFERFSITEMARTLDVDEDSCKASLNYAYFALSEALMSM